VTTVLAFESVGSILVIAMLVVPAAAASLLTHRLHWLLILALVFAGLSALLGHLGAITLPQLAGRWLNHPELGATSSAAMMAVAAGGLFLLAWLAAAIRNRAKADLPPSAGVQVAASTSPR
jgi:manganese/zinc/iron transport system permease protein